MNAMRPLTASLVALVIVAASATAAAARIPRPTHARRDVDPAAAYRRDVEARMQTARARIAWALRSQNLPPATVAQIFREVTSGMQMIRVRIDNHAADHHISPAEDADVRDLAASIAAEMNRHYGAIAPWYLL